MFMITRNELRKLEQGYPPELVDEQWDCETVISGLAKILLDMLTVEETWLGEDLGDKVL